MISYTVSGRVIKCYPIAAVYSGLGEEYSYNLRAEYEAVAERILCKKLASINNNIDSSLSYLKSLEQNYQGDNKKLTELLDNSCIKTKDLALDIQDNQYNLVETISLCNQAHDSVMDLQSFTESNDNEIAHFKYESDHVMSFAFAITVISASVAIYYAPTTKSHHLVKDVLIASLLALPTVISVPAALLYESISFPFPLDKMGYALGNINKACKLLGEIEEYKFNHDQDVY